MSIQLIEGDCRVMLKTLPAESVHCCVTSPPYFGLRDYGHAAQIGLEESPEAYVEELVAVFREVRRVLRDDGTLWLNLGDSYAGGGGFAPNAPSNQVNRPQTRQQGAKAGGIKPSGDIKAKDLIGIPWRVAFALQSDGWYLRQDIIWHKPNPMPESVRDRCTKAHEYVFLLAKSERYFYDADAIAESAAYPEGPGNLRHKFTVAYAAGDERHRTKAGLIKIGARDTRNKRSVWTIGLQPFADAHFATMAPSLAETCIKAGCPVGGTVLDPFGGAGTTGLVADRLQRHAVLIELNPSYSTLSAHRITNDCPLFTTVSSSTEATA